MKNSIIIFPKYIQEITFLDFIKKKYLKLFLFVFVRHKENLQNIE